METLNLMRNIKYIELYLLLLTIFNIIFIYIQIIL